MVEGGKRSVGRYSDRSLYSAPDLRTSQPSETDAE